MEEFTFKSTDEKPSFYEKTTIYRLLHTEEFIEVKVHMKTSEKCNNVSEYVSIMMEKLANLFR